MMMTFRKFTPAIACIFSHSNPYGWPIDPSDLRQEAFLSYWGFSSKEKASKFMARLRKQYNITAELRPSQRLTNCKYELKIWGLPWSYVQGEIAAKDPIKQAMEAA